jgi:hypothetical protein
MNRPDAIGWSDMQYVRNGVHAGLDAQ